MSESKRPLGAQARPIAQSGAAYAFAGGAAQYAPRRAKGRAQSYCALRTRDDAHAVATAVAARASVLAGTPLAIGPDWEWRGD